MNNDDICIHCKRSKEEHLNHDGWETLYCDFTCTVSFKSISQHYAELRGPDNLKLLIEIDNMFRFSKWRLSSDEEALIFKVRQAIEASKPPKDV